MMLPERELRRRQQRDLEMAGRVPGELTFDNGVSQLYRADARSLPLPDGSVHCVVTSPPYWGLRPMRGAVSPGGRKVRRYAGNGLGRWRGRRRTALHRGDEPGNCEPERWMD